MEEVGLPICVDRLSGAGGSGAWRVSGARGAVIVKGSPDGRELHFYQCVAPQLRAGGVAIPELFWSGANWLVMEAVPHPLPRSRWEGDPDVLATLARLHDHATDLDLGALQPFRPQWTAEMTDAALSCLPAEERGALRSSLLAIRERSGDLFAPRCFISGDPNPTNWGLRADGTVVLFDWERFGWGAPALDVAISMPGLPSPDGMAEERVASRYMEIGETPGSAHQFAADMRRAKLWTIVEFLGAHAEGKVAAEAGRTAAWLAAWLPQGVLSIE